MTCLRGDRLITSWVTKSLFPLSSRVLSQQKSYPSLTVCSDGNFKEAWKFGRNAERRIHGTMSSVSGWPCHSETLQWPVLSVVLGSVGSDPSLIIYWSWASQILHLWKVPGLTQQSLEKIPLDPSSARCLQHRNHSVHASDWGLMRVKSLEGSLEHQHIIPATLFLKMCCRCTKQCNR